MFYENSNEAYYSDRSSHSVQVKNNVQSWDMVIANWFGPQFLSQRKDMQKLEFEYKLNGFEKSEYSQSLHTQITFWFDDYSFTIFTSAETLETGLKKPTMVN